MSGLPPIDWDLRIEAERILSGDANELLLQQENLIRKVKELGQESSNAIYGETNKFTPVATSDTSASVSSYGVQTGYYVRFGRMVWFTLHLQWDSADVTGTGNLEITGLPTPTKNQTDADVIMPAYNTESGSEFFGVAIMEPNKKKISEIRNGGTIIQIESANYDFKITGMYRSE